MSIPSKHDDLPIARVHPAHLLMRANPSDRETIYRKQHASFPMLYDPEKALTGHFHFTRAQILQIQLRAPIRINIIGSPPLCGEKKAWLDQALCKEYGIWNARYTHSVQDCMLVKCQKSNSYGKPCLLPISVGEARHFRWRRQFPCQDVSTGYLP